MRGGVGKIRTGESFLLARELSVLLLLEELGELGLEVLGVLAHLLVELVGVLLDHLLELLVVLLHLGRQRALVRLVGEELLVLLLHLLGKLGVEAVELVGELLQGRGHFAEDSKLSPSHTQKKKDRERKNESTKNKIYQ